MLAKETCPKCGSLNAYYEVTTYDINLRCSCGLLKVVQTRLETVTIQHNDTGPDVKLPRKDTILWKTLATLRSLESATSAEVTDRMNRMGYNTLDVSAVSSYLTLLRSKGLVVATQVKRGVSGGSTWVLTEACKSLLGD